MGRAGKGPHKQDAAQTRRSPNKTPTTKKNTNPIGKAPADTIKTRPAKQVKHGIATFARPEAGRCTSQKDLEEAWAEGRERKKRLCREVSSTPQEHVRATPKGGAAQRESE